MATSYCLSVSAPIEIELSKTVVTEGELLWVRAKVANGVSEHKIKAEVIGQDIRLYSTSEPGVYEGMVGIPYEAKPQPILVTVTIDEQVAQVPLEVKPGDFEFEKLTVDPNRVKPPAKMMKRIEQEQLELQAIYRNPRGEKLWTGDFKLPLESEITSRFGTRREFNNEKRGYHNGLDLRAKVGTPIRVPATGVVALAKDLYYSGNTVILDHGRGLFTLYAHMSKISVKSGDRVSPGQLIGFSGQTGRVNGPHLHWGAVVSHVKINPLELTKGMR